jgi:hypothetical protein
MPASEQPFSAPPTVVAIDWSGAAGSLQLMGIRAAVIRDDAPPEIWADLARDDIVTALLDLADERVVVGFDFSFAYPAWAARCRECTSGPEMWDIVAKEGEEWLRKCPPPFFGKKGKKVTHGVEVLRETERAHPPAKSTFLIAGPGAVGTGSIRGIPHLMTLRDAGFAVWPFDPPGDRTVVEIYPTALLRQAKKAHLPPTVVAAARNNKNTRDALGSALVMWEHRDDFARLEAATDETTRLEGAVWTPNARFAGSPSESGG